MIAALRANATFISAAALLLVNAIPLVGVLAWGWSLQLILVVYWIESGIVGVINVLKIAAARGETAATTATPPTRTEDGEARPIGMLGVAGRIGLIGFFVVHYGIFWVVHGTFVFALPMFAGLGSGLAGSGSSREDVWGTLPAGGLMLTVLLLAASHGLSFVVNYLGRGEYRRASPQTQMMSVYGRVVVLHITILGGAFALALLGTPIVALVILVVLKSALDLGLHLREHRRAA